MVQMGYWRSYWGELMQLMQDFHVVRYRPFLDWERKFHFHWVLSNPILGKKYYCPSYSSILCRPAFFVSPDSPSKISPDEVERLNLRKYAEKLRDSLKANDVRFKVSYDIRERILDVRGGDRRETLITIRECNSIRLKNLYVAFLLQCGKDFDVWCQAIRDDSIQSYESIPTP